MVAPVTRVKCPGHITGFFEICKNGRDARYTGSRGAGVCIDKGVETDLTVLDNDEVKVDITLNGEDIAAPVTQSVVNQFLEFKKQSYLVLVRHNVEVPMSAGFGASGAGALSTAYALNKELELNMTRNAIATVAHIAEVENQTGLGDVIAQTYGGVEIRLEPGAPGIGRVDQIIPDPTLKVVCVNMGKLETKSILSNPTHQERINRAGKKLIAELLQNATIENFLRLSKKFMEESELLSSELKELLIYVEDLHSIPASMVMLGESLFTFAERAKSDELKDEIQAYSPELKVFTCEIDYIGPRVIEV